MGALVSQFEGPQKSWSHCQKAGLRLTARGELRRDPGATGPDHSFQSVTFFLSPRGTEDPGQVIGTKDAILQIFDDRVGHAALTDRILLAHWCELEISTAWIRDGSGSQQSATVLYIARGMCGTARIRPREKLALITDGALLGVGCLPREACMLARMLRLGNEVLGC